MKRLNYQNGPLDEVDALILSRLAENARLSNAALAREVGLSPPSLAERVRRLEESGVITGYRAVIDAAKTGSPITAILRIRPVPGALVAVAEILRGIPEITECDRVTGEDCFVTRAAVTSVAHLEAVIDRIIPHAMTNTAIVQSSPVPRRPPPFAAGRGESG